MEISAIIILILIIATTCSVQSLLLFPDKRCVPTDVNQGPSHTCICNIHGVYECRMQTRNLTKSLNILRSKTHCEPNMMYREGYRLCSCNKNGRWKSDNCRLQFEKLLSNTQDNSLAPIGRSGIKCKKGALYLVDCNICRCKDDGIDTVECTNRKCKDTDGRRNKAAACTYGHFFRTENEICACSDINYYIDRLCIKVKNSTVQRLKSHYLNKFLEVNNTNESVDNLNKTKSFKYSLDCNKCKQQNGRLSCTSKLCMLVEDAPNMHNFLRQRKSINTANKNEATPQSSKHSEVNFQDGDKCVPGNIYKRGCNTCSCSEKGNLICTKMECLNKDDLLKLEEMRKKTGHKLATSSD